VKTLGHVNASPEQLPLMSQNRLGVEIICGAAGSGKTTTALLRLRSLCYFHAGGRYRKQNPDPVRVLVLAFNRTLGGYLRALVEEQAGEAPNIELTIETFGRWAQSHLPSADIQQEVASRMLYQLSAGLQALSPEYIVKEADYLLGRFAHDSLEDYITCERTGRGSLPRVDRALRRRILDEVIYPYLAWMQRKGYSDWNSVALQMATDVDCLAYDVVVVDESQDFSANQLRAIKSHLAEDHTVTFVIDTVQRIYARGFTWAEAGFDVRPERIHTLKENYRNTREIATFAAGVLDGIGVEGDGALPNLNATMRSGSLPTLLYGYYSSQVDWAVRYIIDNVDLANETVAFLKPQAGKWFAYLEGRLRASGIPYADITRGSEWPEGNVNVALSSFHSAKGLEFDYVFILGFNRENTAHVEENLDDQVRVLRRLLAVAIARARKEVVLGCKRGEGSDILSFLKAGTFVEIPV